MTTAAAEPKATAPKAPAPTTYTPVDPTTPPNWSNTFVIGWFDRMGAAFAPTPPVNTPPLTPQDVVVLGCPNVTTVPLYAAHVPGPVTVVAVPDGQDPQTYANEVGGIRASAWRCTGFTRP